MPARRCFASPAVLGLLSAAALFGAGGLAVAPASAATNCDLVTASSGSDANAGSDAAPFATVQHLVDSLAAGQTGCVETGTYNGAVTFSHGGSSGAPITLTAYPGQTASIVGRMFVKPGSNFVTVTNLILDGRNTSGANGVPLPSPTVDGSDVTFTANDVTNDHTAICFDLGWIGDANYPNGFPAARVDLERNRIHDCGVLPSNNKEHGIYVENITDARIAWNLIYHNADRGVQLYPNAQRSTVVHNIIDSNGEGVIISGDYGLASSNNTISQNIISNSNIGNDVLSWYPVGNPVGQNNSLTQNCIYGGIGGSIDASALGFTATSNTFADPQYVDASTRNYRLQPTSPCLPITGDIAAVAAGVPQTAPAPTTTTPPPTTTTTSKHHRYVASIARIAAPKARRSAAVSSRRHHHTRRHHGRSVRRGLADRGRRA